MAIATKATRGAVAGSNAWTDPGNAVSDNGVYATCGPAKKGSVQGDWDFAAFTDGELPVGATINSVTVRANYKVSTQGSIASLEIDAGNNGAYDPAESDTSEPLADADFDVVYNTAPSETDLKTAGRLVARIRGVRGNSNTAVTFSLDYVELRVDYSTTQTYPISLVATVVGVVVLSRAATFPKTMAVTVIGVAGLSLAKFYAKTLTAVVTGVATLSRVPTFIMPLSATAIGIAVMTRIATYARILAATAVGVATLARKQFVTMAATAFGSAVLAKANFYAKALSVVSVGVAAMTERLTFGITQSATAVGAASLSVALTVSRALAAVAVGVATLAKQFIAGGGGNDGGKHVPAHTSGAGLSLGL